MEKKSRRNTTHTDAVIRMAWADRITFEEIFEKTGLTESEVIQVMRRNLKTKSFQIWRKRVSNRITKHRKRFESRPHCRMHKNQIED